MKRSNGPRPVQVGRASGTPSPSTDADLARAITRWFKSAARPLPWRTSPRDPYLSLVSEFMLQQTQLSRVLERFPAFIDAFPTLPALASAPLDRVLSHWSGLGYYRRAKNLHAAAREIHSRFGQVPRDVATLESLPGIGRYTAGAISSIVFHQPAPIVDGNVSRILMRIRGRSFPHASPAALAWSWKQAQTLVATAASAGIDPAPLNEGLMELGATICTPRNPDCTNCPVAAHCRANLKSLQHRIPRPKTPVRQSTIFCDSILITDARGRLLVEKRPDSGLWPGLWQAPTHERTDRPARRAELTAWIGLPIQRRLSFQHATTHRAIRFTLWEAEPTRRSAAPANTPGSRRFLSPSQVRCLALSSPQSRILLRRMPSSND